VLGVELIPDDKTGDLYWCPVCLNLTPWEEWLGMAIEENTLKQFKVAEIAAHTLMEMTRWGFSEDLKITLLEKVIEARKYPSGEPFMQE